MLRWGSIQLTSMARLVFYKSANRSDKLLNTLELRSPSRYQQEDVGRSLIFATTCGCRAANCGEAANLALLLRRLNPRCSSARFGRCHMPCRLYHAAASCGHANAIPSRNCCRRFISAPSPYFGRPNSCPIRSAGIRSEQPAFSIRSWKL